MAAHQAPLSLGFSRQEHWSGLPFPFPMHESEKWKSSHSVMSDSSQPHGLQPTRLLHPWDFPGKSTGVGCHCLLRHLPLNTAVAKWKRQKLYKKKKKKVSYINQFCHLLARWLVFQFLYQWKETENIHVQCCRKNSIIQVKAQGTK